MSQDFWFKKLQGVQLVPLTDFEYGLGRWCHEFQAGEGALQGIMEAKYFRTQEGAIAKTFRNFGCRVPTATRGRYKNKLYGFFCYSALF